MQYKTIQYNTTQYNTIQYNTIQYNTILCNTVQYNTIQYNTIQYNTIQYNTIQYNTIQYNTEQYSTIQHDIRLCIFVFDMPRNCHPCLVLSAIFERHSIRITFLSNVSLISFVMIIQEWSSFLSILCLFISTHSHSLHMDVVWDSLCMEHLHSTWLAQHIWFAAVLAVRFPVHIWSTSCPSSCEEDSALRFLHWSARYSRMVRAVVLRVQQRPSEHPHVMHRQRIHAGWSG